MEKVRQFLFALRTDPRITELVKQLPVPSSDEEAAGHYLRLAEILGFQFTRQELLEGLQNLARFRRILADRAEADLQKSGLDAESLDLVAGGTALGEDLEAVADPISCSEDVCGSEAVVQPCEDTFTPGEWCWWTDSCYEIINIYVS